MEASKSFKKAVLVSVVSTVASVVVAYVGKRLLSKMDDRRQYKTSDRILNSALQDSMDCSDPVTKY